MDDLPIEDLHKQLTQIARDAPKVCDNPLRADHVCLPFKVLHTTQRSAVPGARTRAVSLLSPAGKRLTRADFWGEGRNMSTVQEYLQLCQEIPAIDDRAMEDLQQA